MSLTKDSQHTRVEEIKSFAITVFSGSNEDVMKRYDQFAEQTFVWPNGSLRKPSGQYIRRLLDRGYRPNQVSSELIDDMVPLLTAKNISNLVEMIASSEPGRRWLIESFPQESISCLSNQQLSVVSVDLIRDIFQAAQSPEDRAEILCLSLGKEQMYDGLVSYALNKK